MASHSLKATKVNCGTAIGVYPLEPHIPHSNCAHHTLHDALVDGLELGLQDGRVGSIATSKKRIYHIQEATANDKIKCFMLPVHCPCVDCVQIVKGQLVLGQICIPLVVVILSAY